MGLLGRRQHIALNPPTSFFDGNVLPSADTVRLLTNKRALDERDDFLGAVLNRYETDPSCLDAAESLASQLVALLPPNRHSPESLREIALRGAAIGIAVADEEEARGWAHEGEVDSVAWLVLDWDLTKGRAKEDEDVITGPLSDYAIAAGFYLASQASASADEVASGMVRFARFVADEGRASSTPQPEQAQTAPISKTKVCPDCGSVVSRASGKCRYCGYSFAAG